MAVSDDEVIAELTACGEAVSDYFLIGGGVFFVNRRGELMSSAIDDPELAAAVVGFLRRLGVREYSSYNQYLDTRHNNADIADDSRSG
jgi:hypothetical protein